MKKSIFVFVFLAVWNQSVGQQIINHVFDPGAFAIRGITIPGMLVAAAVMKNAQANRIIPGIISEERTLISKWRRSVFGTVNTLNALKIASGFLVTSIDVKRALVFPVHYAPGFRQKLRDFLVIKERIERLDLRVAALLGIGSLFVDGEGYYRVAAQRLAIEYLDTYAKLSKIDFQLTQLLAFIDLLPLLTS